MDLQHLAELLDEAFPEVASVAPLTILGEGFGSLVVESAGGAVFRIAKHAAAQDGQRRERLVLPLVQGELPDVHVPRIAYHRPPSPAFPSGVVGYEKLPGRPLAPIDLDGEHLGRVAGQVAGFLTALHGIDLWRIEGIGLPTFPPSRERRAEAWANVAAYLDLNLRPSEVRSIRRRLDTLLDYERHFPFVPVLVHADLWYENLLFDEARARLVGVIDFENLSIGDPAIDLATQGYLGDSFSRAVQDAYHRGHPPPDLARRIRALLVLRELLGLEHGVVTGRVDPDALGKVVEAVRSDPR